MIVAYMKCHGAEFMLTAAPALAAISEEDFQQCIVNKFLGIQKSLHQAKLLNSENNHIVQLMKEVGS